MEYWAWTRCALFMHIVKYERKKPPFVFHCKSACAIIIDNINHYSKCLYIPCWSRPTTQNIALSGIRMHTICLIKCILFHIYLYRLYVIIRRHGVETPSTLLALCELITFGRWIPLVIGHYDDFFFFFFLGGGVNHGQTFEKQSSPVVGDFEGNDLRRHDAPWRHWNL